LISTTIPKKIENISSLNVIDLACGKDFTLAIILDKNN